MLTQVRQSSLSIQKWQTHVEQCHAHKLSQRNPIWNFQELRQTPAKPQTAVSWKPRPVLLWQSVGNMGTAHYSLWPTISHNTLTAFITFVDRTSLRLLWHERRAYAVVTDSSQARSTCMHFTDILISLCYSAPGKNCDPSTAWHDINHKNSFVNKLF